MNAPRLRHDFRKLNLSTAARGSNPGPRAWVPKKLMENKLTTVPRFATVLANDIARGEVLSRLTGPWPRE